ncbi:MAG: ribosomal protein L13e [Candidatus Thorarchaeota archaeon]|jgi:large subunit ribosomal protein L13e
MSFDIIAEPTVKSPRDGRPKRGRGFSSEETAQAGLTIDEARRMGLIVDLRRKTVHSENVDALKQYMKDLEKLVASLAEEAKPVKAKVAKPVDDLGSLRAVKKTEVPLLVKAGIKSFEDLAYCDISKVANKTGIDEDRITAMVKAALRKV